MGPQKVVALARISTLSLSTRAPDPVFLPQTCEHRQSSLQKPFLCEAIVALVSKMAECTEENWGLLTTTATRDKSEATPGAGQDLL